MADIRDEVKRMCCQCAFVNKDGTCKQGATIQAQQLRAEVCNCPTAGIKGVTLAPPYHNWVIILGLMVKNNREDWVFSGTDQGRASEDDSGEDDNAWPT